METIYTVEYFIEKFEKIPESMWVTNGLGSPGGPRCALGHCLRDHEMVNDESAEFVGALLIGAVAINNGGDPRYQQPTPKQRILAALYDIKVKQDAEKPKVEKPRIVYVTVDAAVRELQKSVSEN